jgi:hypothetical protein
VCSYEKLSLEGTLDNMCVTGYHQNKPAAPVHKSPIGSFANYSTGEGEAEHERRALRLDAVISGEGLERRDAERTEDLKVLECSPEAGVPSARRPGHSVHHRDLRIEVVTHTALRPNQARCRRVHLDLAPQAHDLDVNRAVIYMFTLQASALDQLIARQNALRRRNQRLQ